MAEDKKDLYDGDYLGNIWGWKFSMMGLVLILFLLSIILYRHWQLGVPFGLEQEPQEKVEATEAPSE